jgi:hypothetical protein
VKNWKLRRKDTSDFRLTSLLPSNYLDAIDDHFFPMECNTQQRFVFLIRPRPHDVQTSFEDIITLLEKTPSTQLLRKSFPQIFASQFKFYFYFAFPRLSQRLNVSQGVEGPRNIWEGV